MKRLQFLMGILCGMILCAGISSAASAASGVMAVLSHQAVYVDGKPVSMTAYAIAGNNYVKLRDVGQAVGFNVYWDGQAVQVESGKPYTGTASNSQNTPSVQPTADTVTEESVKAALDALKARYPHGSIYPAPYHSTSNGPYGATNINCAGWAILCSDAAFGNLPWCKTAFCWNDVRVGDLVQYDNQQGSHVIVVLDKTDDWLYFTDSGPSLKAYWIGGYTREWLEQRPGLVLYTRYPS